MGVMRTLQVDDRLTPLAQAIAEIGRIGKTVHTLNFIDTVAARANLRRGRVATPAKVALQRRPEQ